MRKTQFAYLSADQKTTIRAYIWEPDTAPQAVLQIAHGITEHMGRYEELACYFTERGYVVAGNDHLGHGRSMDGQDALPMYFGPDGSWAYVLADCKACAEELKKRYAGIPYCLMGFSLGSFVVRCLLGRESDLADLAVWAGTGQMKPAELWFAGAIAGLEERRFGDEKDTPLLHKLTMDTYNKKFQPCRTGSDWICANPEAVDEYIADPLCGDGFTVSSFRELLRGMKQSGQDVHVAKMNTKMPILLISGQDDPVGNFGKGVEAVCAQLKRHGFTDVENRLFAGMRHDIFREKERMAVFACLENWMQKHL